VSSDVVRGDLHKAGSLSVLRSVQNTTQSEHHVEVLDVKPGGT
jgi:hypothetical protein